MNLSTGLRVGTLVALVGVAYHYSLEALFRSLSYDTPLAYLALVPIVMLGVAVFKVRPRPGELRLPDRQIDWLIGLPMLALAAGIAVVVPQRVSYQFWTNRLDLLGLPFFVAGAVAILLGSRVLHRLRLPIAALALAWPYPYQGVLDRTLVFTQRVAVSGLRVAASSVGAHALTGSVFTVGHGQRTFSVNVAPMCAGASSAFGFILLGGATLMVVTGRRLTKVAWLVVGVAAMLTLNTVRLILLFWVGNQFGQRVAMTWLHPYMGLVLFALGTSALMLVLRRLGLQLPIADTTEAALPGARPTQVVAVLIVFVIAIALGRVNGELKDFSAFAGMSTVGLQTSLTQATPPPASGWSGQRFATIEWASPYFGTGSTWVRYLYDKSSLPPTSRARPIFVDVVDSADLDSFSHFGLEACYRFHDFRLLRSARVGLRGPVPAQTITYHDSAGDLWVVLSWVRPIAVPAGKRFERVVLLQRADRSTIAALDDEIAFAHSISGGNEVVS